MNIAEVIKYLYPGADSTFDFRVIDDGSGQVVDYWNIRDADGKLVEQPTQAEYDANWLTICKNNKIADLNRTCNETILGGFTSNCLEEPHQYDFNYEAQTNLNGLQNKILGDTNFVGRGWKTLDAGIVYHTREQLIQLFNDGYAWKDSNVAHYWGLKLRVQAATTEEEVNSIEW